MNSQAQPITNRTNSHSNRIYNNNNKLRTVQDKPKQNTMKSVTYSSTRGGQHNLDFRTVVMTGLAHDRGLFVPDTFPTVEKEELESWRSLSFPDVAVKVLSKYVKEDQVPAEKLEDIVKRSCAAFRHEEVTPVIDVAGHKVLVREQ